MHENRWVCRQEPFSGVVGGLLTAALLHASPCEATPDQTVPRLPFVRPSPWAWGCTAQTATLAAMQCTLLATWGSPAPTTTTIGDRPRRWSGAAPNGQRRCQCVVVLPGPGVFKSGTSALPGGFALHSGGLVCVVSPEGPRPAEQLRLRRQPLVLLAPPTHPTPPHAHGLGEGGSALPMTPPDAHAHDQRGRPGGGGGGLGGLEGGGGGGRTQVNKAPHTCTSWGA